MFRLGTRACTLAFHVDALEFWDEFGFEKSLVVCSTTVRPLFVEVWSRDHRRNAPAVAVSCWPDRHIVISCRSPVGFRTRPQPQTNARIS